MECRLDSEQRFRCCCLGIGCSIRRDGSESLNGSGRSSSSRLRHDCLTEITRGSAGGTRSRRQRNRRYGPDTRFAAMMLLTAISLPERLQVVQAGMTEIDLWTLWPLYPEELRFKKQHGAAALACRFDDAAVSDVVDPTRASVVDESGSEGSARPFDERRYARHVPNQNDHCWLRDDRRTVPGRRGSEAVPQAADGRLSALPRHGRAAKCRRSTGEELMDATRGPRRSFSNDRAGER